MRIEQQFASQILGGAPRGAGGVSLPANAPLHGVSIRLVQGAEHALAHGVESAGQRGQSAQFEAGGEVVAQHLGEVPRQTEAGHVRCGARCGAQGDFGRGAVAGLHLRQGCFYIAATGFVLHMGGKKRATAERLGQDQHVARLRAPLGQGPSAVWPAVYGEGDL